MKTKNTKLSEIRPYKKNPRSNEKAVQALASSIKAYGFRQPIVIDKSGVIVCGETRYKAAKLLGLKTVPTHTAEDLNPTQIRAYRLADNKLGEIATWEFGLLTDELKALNKAKIDLNAIGFKDSELKALFEPRKGKTEPDAIPSQKTTNIKNGDVYELGKHRIMCGDATKAADYKKLMKADKADLVFTDPPYGVSYESAEGSIMGDKKRDDDLLGKLLAPAFKNMVRHTKDSAAFYIWHASNTRRDFDEALTAAGLEEKQYIIWVKDSLVLGWADYHSQHEPCFYLQKCGQSAKWYGTRSNTTTWRITTKQNGEHFVSLVDGLRLSDGNGSEIYLTPKSPKNKKTRLIRTKDAEAVNISMPADDTSTWEVKRITRNYVHPAEKPTELARRAIENSTPRGGTVLDTFLGSGSTLIAAEQQERICYGLELDPKYVQVIISRWEAFTGRKAKRIANG